jgi:cytochrome bd-type quinol oxidase subunit 2
MVDINIPVHYKDDQEEIHNMAAYLTILVAIIGLLITIWGQVTPHGVGAKRVSAWCAIVIVTLIFPSAIIIWAVIQISARLLAPTSTDVSTFVSSIAWLAGVSGSIYPLIWGMKFRQKLDAWLSEIISSPEKGKDEGDNNTEPGE